MKNSIFLILSFLIVTSCSIEKRLYNKGYHVDWHKKDKHTSTEETANRETKTQYNNSETAKTQTPQIEQSESENNRIELVPDNARKTNEYSDNIFAEEKSFDRKEGIISVHTTTKSISLSEVSTEPKKEGVAIASLILGLLGISVVAIVLGLIQINKVNKQPTIYGGKGMATAGVLLGYLWIVFCCFFFLPFQFGVGTLLVVSLLFAIYGMITLTRNEKTEPLGILATILGWLGFMASIFLLFDYQ